MTAKAPSNGWVVLLRPNPELWTKVLQHRTQILYAADISLTCLMLELQPGMTGNTMPATHSCQHTVSSTIVLWLGASQRANTPTSLTALTTSGWCAVLECGTGSGSLTHALARAVAPSGRVHTFEYHAPRAQAAEKEFLENDISRIVSVQERDIQANGFPVALHGCADALFLDVPGPWQVSPGSSTYACSPVRLQVLVF